MPRPMTMEEKKEAALERREKVENVSEAKDGRRRRSRGVFNGTKGKLSIEGSIPGYHMHIFNDDPGRIQNAIDNGYEFVTPEEVETGTNVVSNNTDVGDKVRFLVGTDGIGEPKYGYLMKIKQEWYDEDQAALQRRNDMTDAAIKRGKLDGISSEGFYDAGIKMSGRR